MSTDHWPSTLALCGSEALWIRCSAAYSLLILLIQFSFFRLQGEHTGPVPVWYWAGACAGMVLGRGLSRYGSGPGRPYIWHIISS